MKQTLKDEIRSLRKEVRSLALLELVVVAVLLGLLVSAAVPRYTGYVKKARATEAIARLSSIMTASKLFYQKAGRWPESPGEIGYYADFSSSERFTYQIVPPETNDGGFTLRAVGKDIDGMEDVLVTLRCTDPASEGIVEVRGTLAR
jgi:type II secretory pathway pseudopilin PulG